MNVCEYIKKNSDSPKLNDVREECSKPSVFEKKVLPSEVKAILADFENKLQHVPYILRVRTNVGIRNFSNKVSSALGTVMMARVTL
jgi:hypothetical protein